MAKEDKHAFIKIGEDIKAGNIPAVILLQGKEEFLVNFYAEILIHEFINKAAEALDLLSIDRNDVTVNGLIEATDTLPLMSKRKVVYIPHFIDAAGKYPEAFSKGSESKEELANAILGMTKGKKVNSDELNSILIITIPRQKEDKSYNTIKSSELYKAISKAGSVYDFEPLNRAQLNGFIDKRLSISGKRYRPMIISSIVEKTGYGSKGVDYDLYTLDNDLKKIIAHAGKSDEITINDVINTVTISPEHDVFAMIDAISENKKDEALRLLHNLLASDSSIFQLLALITKQLEIMLTACEMKDSGMNLVAIQDSLNKSDKIHPYRTKRALETGKRFRRQHLREILKASYEIEPNIKTGLMPEQLALEFFIAGI